MVFGDRTEPYGQEDACEQTEQGQKMLAESPWHRLTGAREEMTSQKAWPQEGGSPARGPGCAWGQILGLFVSGVSEDCGAVARSWEEIKSVHRHK